MRGRPRIRDGKRPERSGCEVCGEPCEGRHCGYCASPAIRIRAEADEIDPRSQCAICGRPAEGSTISSRFCELCREAGVSLYYAARQHWTRLSRAETF